MLLGEEGAGGALVLVLTPEYIAICTPHTTFSYTAVASLASLVSLVSLVSRLCVVHAEATADDPRGAKVRVPESASGARRTTETVRDAGTPRPSCPHHAGERTQAHHAVVTGLAAFGVRARVVRGRVARQRAATRPATQRVAREYVGITVIKDIFRFHARTSRDYHAAPFVSRTIHVDVEAEPGPGAV